MEPTWIAIAVLAVVNVAQWAANRAANRTRDYERKVDWLYTYVAGQHDADGRVTRMGVYDWLRLSDFTTAGGGGTGDPDGIKPPDDPPPM